MVQLNTRHTTLNRSAMFLPLGFLSALWHFRKMH